MLSMAHEGCAASPLDETWGNLARLRWQGRAAVQPQQGSGLLPEANAERRLLRVGDAHRPARQVRGEKRAVTRNKGWWQSLPSTPTRTWGWGAMIDEYGPFW